MNKKILLFILLSLSFIALNYITQLETGVELILSPEIKIKVNILLIFLINFPNIYNKKSSNLDN